MQPNLDVKKFIQNQCWTFAKTMPQWPHWYVVRCKGNTESFSNFASYINVNGEIRSWGNEKYIYLDIDGYTYWTMGNPIDETTIINRAQITSKDL